MGEEQTILVVVIIVIVGVVLTDAGSALGELGRGTLRVADAVDLLAVAGVGVVAVPGSVDHCLADRAALCYGEDG